MAAHAKRETDPEIEVTSEMIAAGINAYWREANPGIEDGDNADRKRILTAVFIAMLAVSGSTVRS
jgi:hypothetical protein